MNDLNFSLSQLLEMAVNQPEKLASEYQSLWEKQLTNDPAEYYKKIRNEFNNSHNPVRFLYLMARCVKGSVRYNTKGEFNQSPDNRRLGTNPERMKNNIFSIADLMKNKKCKFMSVDYRKVTKLAKKSDVVYMDPPYQGVCGDKDSRYYSGIDTDDFIRELETLNNKDIKYIISYDGQSGNKKYGKKLPTYLNLKQVKIRAGLSSQATLLGRKEETIESLYLSEKLLEEITNERRLF